MRILLKLIPGFFRDGQVRIVREVENLLNTRRIDVRTRKSLTDRLHVPISRRGIVIRLRLDGRLLGLRIHARCLLSILVRVLNWRW